MRRLFLLCVLVASTVASAAEPIERPKVGLVLSGGGALGIAHVGVLKVLEELRVPVHCVAGNSMGAIIGGTFAAGYTPQEIEDVLLAIRWSDLLDDRPDRRRVPFRRKQDDLTFLSRVEVGFNHGRFQLPSALVEGQKLNFLLQALTIHTVGLESFDDLPVPFRAVATDLETGEEVILDHGDLALAIRASMAVPGVFSPVEINGQLLVDGGLVNNLPVDQGRALGADVVIAVDVGEPLRTREQLESLSGVTRQVLRMMTARNVARQTPDADLVIHPAVEEFATSDFNKAEEMIVRGEQAARRVAEELRRFAVSDDEYARYKERFQIRDLSEPTVTSIQVASESRTDPKLVLREVRTRPGDLLVVPLDDRRRVGRHVHPERVAAIPWFVHVEPAADGGTVGTEPETGRTVGAHHVVLVREGDLDHGVARYAVAGQRLVLPGTTRAGLSDVGCHLGVGPGRRGPRSHHVEVVVEDRLCVDVDGGRGIRTGLDEERHIPAVLQGQRPG